jgi:hypothetical protein
VTGDSKLRLALGLLGYFLPPDQRDAVLGDLVEEYEVRVQSSSSVSSAGWLFAQVCRSIPSFVWMATMRGAWLSTVAVALGAWAAAGLVEFVGTSAISRFLGPQARLVPVLSTIVGLLTILAGGYVDVSLRAGAAKALAGVVLIAVVALMATTGDNAPLWYQVTFLTVGPLAALTGGTLAGQKRAGESRNKCR